MKRDLEPIIFTHAPDQDVVIRPLFDAHIGARECDLKGLQAFVQDVLANEGHYVVIGGDMIDNGTKSSVTNTYEQVYRPRDQKRIAAELLEPLAKAGRVLCGTSGNHEARGVKEVDDDALYDIFAKLDIEHLFRENVCFLFVRSEPSDGDPRRIAGRRRPFYALAVMHGAGGGMYIGSGANRLERYGAIIDGLDGIIIGHTHKPMQFPVAKIKIDCWNNTITQKHFAAMTAPSWLDYGGYPIRKMLPPVSRADARMILSGHYKKIKIVSDVTV